MKYKRPSKKILEKIYSKTNNKCFYCGLELEKMTIKQEKGKPMRTLDHKIPQNRGGKDDEKNLVLCCSTCNSKKGLLNDFQFKMIREIEFSEDYILAKNNYNYYINIIKEIKSEI